MYEALPPEEFKELFMAMLKYKYGDDSIVDTINNPVVKALFISEKTDIDYNEKKWAERAQTARQNGAKSSGRPKKEKEQPEPEIEVSTYTPKEEEKPKNEVEFAESIKDLYKSDRYKAERIMNRECRENGYSFDNVLSVIKAS